MYRRQHATIYQHLTYVTYIDTTFIEQKCHHHRQYTTIDVSEEHIDHLYLAHPRR